MSHVEHESPRAFEAATKVDPMILAKALDHIARTAARSRSQTRRLRWIERRALIALSGEEYRDIDVDLPKSAGPDTHEKLQRRMAYHIALQHELRECLQDLIGWVPGREAWHTDEPIKAVKRAHAVIAKQLGDSND